MLGSVSALTVYPLKSARGVSLERAQLSAGGLAGDRRWALARDGQVLGAKQVPAVTGWSTRVEDGALLVDTGAGWRTAEGAAAEIGCELVEADGSQHQMSAALHLVSLGAETAADAPPGCDPVMRANVLLELAQPGAERGWLGRQLRLGTTVLTVTKLPKHCFGVYADVLTAGEICLGDSVRWAILGSNQ